MLTDDRRILEDVIFRAIYGHPHYRRFLFVGCHRYSAWYPNLFRARPGTEIESIDPDPESAKFGAFTHHQLAFQDFRFKELEGRFDLILLNGVFGYGINIEADKLASLKTAAFILREGGILIIGYRNGKECDFDPRLIDTFLFDQIPVPGFNSLAIKSSHSNGHSYITLRKRG